MDRHSLTRGNSCRPTRSRSRRTRPRTLTSSGWRRSEEHTSELQSPDHLVCRLPVSSTLSLHDALPICRHFTLVLLTLSLPFICLAGRPLFGDVWWVMANGQALFDQGQLLQADPFTFAPHTSTYFDVQWLA